MELIKTLTGLEVEAKLVKTYSKGKLFFAQERLCLTDLDNNELISLDLLDYLTDIL